jgi:hypothetical protein
VFVKKALEVGTQNSATLPASLLEEMRQEAPLFETVALIQLAVDPLQKQIDDTVLQVGGEAYAPDASFLPSSKAPFREAAFKNGGGDFGKRFDRKTPDGRDR